MARHFSRAALLVIGCLACGPLDAAMVTYSWSGSVAGTGPGGANPWGLGVFDRDFQLEVDVDAAAPDSSAAVPFAAFTPSAVRLKIGGSSYAVSGGTRLSF